MPHVRAAADAWGAAADAWDMAGAWAATAEAYHRVEATHWKATADAWAGVGAMAGTSGGAAMMATTARAEARTTARAAVRANNDAARSRKKMIDHAAIGRAAAMATKEHERLAIGLKRRVEWPENLRAGRDRAADARAAANEAADRARAAGAAAQRAAGQRAADDPADNPALVGSAVAAANSWAESENWSAVMFAAYAAEAAALRQALAAAGNRTIWQMGNPLDLD